MTPVKFGISFTLTILNQAGALVLIYRDGTCRNHGGTEMGQALHEHRPDRGARTRHPAGKYPVMATHDKVPTNTRPPRRRAVRTERHGGEACVRAIARAAEGIPHAGSAPSRRRWRRGVCGAREPLSANLPPHAGHLHGLAERTRKPFHYYVGAAVSEGSGGGTASRA